LRTTYDNLTRDKALDEYKNSIDLEFYVNVFNAFTAVVATCDNVGNFLEILRNLKKNRDDKMFLVGTPIIQLLSSKGGYSLSLLRKSSMNNSFTSSHTAVMNETNIMTGLNIDISKSEFQSTIKQLSLKKDDTKYMVDFQIYSEGEKTKITYDMTINHVPVFSKQKESLFGILFSKYQKPNYKTMLGKDMKNIISNEGNIKILVKDKTQNNKIMREITFPYSVNFKEIQSSYTYLMQNQDVNLYFRRNSDDTNEIKLKLLTIKTV